MTKDSTTDKTGVAHGNRLLHLTVEVADDLLGPSLAAAFAIGSLAHGGFASLVSDVDIALILDAVDDQSSGRIEEVARVVRSRSECSLSQRLSLFWSDWPGVHGRGGAPIGRLPAVDRLDLLESGRLLHGSDLRASAVPPDNAALIRETAAFAIAKFGFDYLDAVHRPALLLVRGPRAVTKAVLFPVRFLFTLATGQIGRNSDAAAWYTSTSPARELVCKAMSWRLHGIDDADQADALLSAHLRDLYIQFACRYGEELRRSGEVQLASQMSVMAAQIAQPDH